PSLAPIRIVGWAREPGREKKELPPCPEDVELLGPKAQQELRDLYACASIYIATSRYEPFGLSPLEAALSGCALVMNDIPVFHELWGDAGVYFKKDDAVDLAYMLEKLRNDPELRNEYAQRAYELALDNFSAVRMVEQYERI